MQPSDAALIEGCRAGDDQAWAALIERYQRLVYSIPRRSGLDEDQAADVFQHVFATLLTKLDSISQPERIAAWLVTTARRETWRQSRRNRGFERLEADDEESQVQLAADEPLPEETLVRMEQQHEIRTAVQALDDRCRTLLTLLFYHAEPPPYTEIATAIGVPEGSIGPTRARCLQKLRRLLDA